MKSDLINNHIRNKTYCLDFKSHLFTKEVEQFSRFTAAQDTRLLFPLG